MVKLQLFQEDSIYSNFQNPSENPDIHIEDLLILYIALHRKCFFFNILEDVLAYDLVKIIFMKKKGSDT